jgi:hypothetical protein
VAALWGIHLMKDFGLKSLFLTKNKPVYIEYYEKTILKLQITDEILRKFRADFGSHPTPP